MSMDPIPRDAYVAAYAASEGLALEEAGLRLAAMHQVIDTIAAAVREDDLAYDHFAAFGLGSVDIEGNPIKMMAELADMATTAVGLLTRPPYPAFDTKGYAERVVAAFGQRGWHPGRDTDLTAVPPQWWQSALGRLVGRVLRADG